MRTGPHFSIAAGARAFCLLALGAPVLWYRDLDTLVALLTAALLWSAVSLYERYPWLLPRVGPLQASIAGAALLGALCGAVVATAPALLLALVVPPFTTALILGLRSAVLALSTELAVVVGVGLAWNEGLSADESLAIFTWALAGLGLSFIGNFVHATTEEEPDELAPYLDAQRLIKQLLDLSGELRGGLDAASMAGGLVSEVRDVLPATAVGVYLPRGEVLVPLVTHADDDAPLEPAEHLAVESWARTEPIVFEECFAFPLGEGAVIAGTLAASTDLPQDEVERRILDLTCALRPGAVRLDTALLFSDFRDSATADVRKRLAREMHDGVAQDIASLGYVVDALAARPADEKQAKQLAMLRDRITKVVAEVRQSVLTLRTSIGESESLGTAIGTIARHLSESSRIPIQVTLDEHATRLRPAVEAELFRIAQEAMNNAIKHAQCSAIEVVCQVQAPDVFLRISDDGRGLGTARSDSHGLKIMRERARLAGATLDIGESPSGGVSVQVQIGTRAGPVPTQPTGERVTP
ncbi:MAG: hypothetical protein CMH83_08645 [Nocardioides sp.]|nr:hypothetical protein [Nocardioides sp.]